MASGEGNNKNKDAAKEKTWKEVSMVKLSTHETEVKNATSFTVMSSTGDIIIWGEGPRGIIEKLAGHPWSFYVYNKSGGKWKSLKKFKALCRHPRIHMLPIKISDKGELLAVSCVDCKLIRLYNMETGDVKIVFRGNECRPGRMCHGKSGRIFVIVASENKHLHVLELDYTRGDEFHICRESITHRSFRHYNGMVAWVPSQTSQSIVVSGNHPKKTVRSICLNGRKPGWEQWYGGWEQQIDGMEFSPSGIVYSPRHKVLLIADKMNNRVVVLNPEDGSHIQTVPLENMGHIIQMCLHKDEIVVWHCDPYGSKKNECISYFSTPMFAWDKLKP